MTVLRGALWICLLFFQGGVYAQHHDYASVFNLPPVEEETPPEVIDTAPTLLKQIGLEVYFIEISLEKNRQYDGPFHTLAEGLSGSVNPSSKKITFTNSIELSLKQLISSGQAFVLARPMIILEENVPAEVQVGDEIPYLTQTITNQTIKEQIHHIQTGITLSLQAHYLSDTKIHVSLDTSIKLVKVWRDLGSQSHPILAKRTIKTAVQLHENEALLFAGLIDRQEKETQTSIPLLGQIPFLGHLFRGVSHSQTNTDVMIILKPFSLEDHREDRKAANSKPEII